MILIQQRTPRPTDRQQNAKTKKDAQHTQDQGHDPKARQKIMIPN